MPPVHVCPGDAEPRAAQSRAARSRAALRRTDAGARRRGSGKTRVLTTRIARLIEHHGVDPRQSSPSRSPTRPPARCASASRAAWVDTDPTGMWSGTFHAIGARMLRAACRLVGRTPSFTIYDEDDTLGVIKRIMERVASRRSSSRRRSIASSISDAKNALVTPAEYRALRDGSVLAGRAPQSTRARASAARGERRDFDDLLVLPVRMLARERGRCSSSTAIASATSWSTSTRTRTARSTSSSSCSAASTATSLSSATTTSRSTAGAAPTSGTSSTSRRISRTRTVVRLEENYRSTPQILELANVGDQREHGRRGKTLRATRPGGERVTVVARARRARRSGLRRRGDPRRVGAVETRALRDFAVLYRTNAQSRALEEALRSHAIPYRLVGAVRFYDRREIRDLMAYLKLIANPADDEAFRRAVAVPEARARRDDDRSSSRRIAAVRPCRCSRPRRDPDLRRRTAAGGAQPRSASSRASSSACASARRSASTSCCASSSRRFATPIISRPKAGSARDRLDNVRELITAPRRPSSTRAAKSASRRSIISSSAPRSSPTSTRSTRRRRGDADDAAQREGARVSGRVHHRPRGRAVPARASVRRSADARGGAPAVLRRDHARRERSCTSPTPRSVAGTAR